MQRSLINRLVAPGERPNYGFFVACLMCIGLICLLDIRDGTDVREDVLYPWVLCELAFACR